MNEMKWNELFRITTGYIGVEREKKKNVNVNTQYTRK